MFMKKLFFVTFCLLCYLSASSQDYLLEATACFEKGDYECAKRSYTLFQALDGKDMSEQIKLADECLRIRNLANDYFKDGEYERAKDRYKLVLERNPKDPIAQRLFDECEKWLTEERQKALELQQQLEEQKAKELQQQQEQINEQTPPAATPETSGDPVVDAMIQNMVYVEGGSFMMGNKNDDALKSEKPVHQVIVSDFLIGKYQVTQKEWQAVMHNNPSINKGDDYPVDNVSWLDVQEFLRRLNRFTGEKYRLPTEAEWEFAARGGNGSKGYQYAGSNDIKEVAWYAGNSDHKTHQVGLKMANELGLYDMSGNLWEWCNDWYGSYREDTVINPQGPSTGSLRILRGGSNGHAGPCRPVYRYGYGISKKSRTTGFRIAVSLE